MCKVKNICHDARGALDFPKSILSTHNAILNQTLTIFSALHCNCFTALQACLVIPLAQGGGGRGRVGGRGSSLAITYTPWCLAAN
jgi:hypothetical protein